MARTRTARNTPTVDPGRANLALAWRVTRRELRGGLKGFRIFLACLLLGVAAIAGVGSMSEAMLSGLRADARSILGGEAELSLIHEDISAEERGWLAERARRLSHVAEMRAMARTEDSRLLVELKGVDDAYPLFGGVRLDTGGANGLQSGRESLDTALDKSSGQWGALVEDNVLQRMDLSVGDSLRIGELTYAVRGTIEREPDRATRTFTLGPRVMVARESLAETGLVQPGSLIHYYYRLDLPAGTDFQTWKRDLNSTFPEAGWRLRGLDEAAPGIQRLVGRVTLFMTLVGLTALLVGGVGVANAVRSYLDEKRPVIATLKCLGAPAALIFQVYLLQVMVLAALGILGGLLVGAAAPFLAGPALARQLNFDIAVALYPGPMVMAAAFGVLTTLAFSLWPLGRAQGVPAAALFRDVVADVGGRVPRAVWLAVAFAVVLLAALAVWSAEDRLFAAGFVAGAAGALILFRLAAEGIRRLAAATPRLPWPGLRLAVANLHRPGAATGSVVLSLGLGITVLVAIALIRGNLQEQVTQTMPQDAPAFFFIDIQPDQVGPFVELLEGHEGVREVRAVPMLRGRITAVKDTAVEELTIPEDVRWVFRGDRGVTWTREPPRNPEGPDGDLMKGSWWPADYRGDPLKVSLGWEIGRALGLEIGDTLTVNVLGRDITAEIANLRRIEWDNLTINFIMVFSPGVLEQAPQTHLATVKMDPGQEAALEEKVAERFPNISSIQVRDVLDRFAGVLENIAFAVTAMAMVTLVAGVLVLAGAVAAGHHRRIYDSVVLKVLGATRQTVGRAFILEYGLLGLATAVIAAVVGTAAAWIVVTEVMRAEFVFLPAAAVLTALLAAVLTIGFGFVGTWRALAQKAAPYLRNE